MIDDEMGAHTRFTVLAYFLALGVDGAKKTRATLMSSSGQLANANFHIASLARASSTCTACSST